MLVVIYNCPIFVKVGGWSFTLLPGRHTKFGLNQLKTEKVSPQHILLLGAVSRPVHPVKVALLKSLPHCLLSPPPAKKIKIVGLCPNLLGNRPWPLYWPGISLERDDMKLILNLWWTDNFNKSHNAHVPYHTIHHWEQKCAHFCSECYMLWDMGNVQCEICDIVQLSQNKIKCNSIMVSPGLICIRIYPPGDRGLMYILVY